MLYVTEECENYEITFPFTGTFDELKDIAQLVEAHDLGTARQLMTAGEDFTYYVCDSKKYREITNSGGNPFYTSIGKNIWLSTKGDPSRYHRTYAETIYNKIVAERRWREHMKRHGLMMFGAESARYILADMENLASAYEAIFTERNL